MKKIRYFIEAALLLLFMGLFKILPLDAASAAGGFIGRSIGPYLPSSRKARRNLEQTMPALSAAQHTTIIKTMWDNLGRVMAEYPHLEKIARERITLKIDPQVDEFLKNDRPCMMIAAHLANWEIAAAAMLARFGKPLDLTYRAPNNPWADKLLLRVRSLKGKIKAYPKSREGGHEMIKAMREGRYIAMLIDQKYNEGIAAPFLDRPAMTNPVFATLSRKFDYPIVPAQIERKSGAHFIITLHAPLDVKNLATEDIVAAANECLSQWIKKNPGQWLWLHRRWNSEKLKRACNKSARLDE